MNFMDKKDILDRLIKIASIRGSGRTPWIAADALWQERLFDVQEAFTNLMSELANETGRAHELVEKFPYAFEPTQ